MARWGRLSASAALVIGALAIASVSAAAVGLELLPPHTARRSAATLDTKLLAEIDAATAAAAPSTVEAARDLALEITARHLHFGLDHPTSLAFGAVDREGNCIEYAHLFARVFDRIVAARGIRARAYAVHSASARLFGLKLPMRGFDDHDWALVESSAATHYVDPSFFDAGLGWDTRAHVVGSVKAPK